MEENKKNVTHFYSELPNSNPYVKIKVENEKKELKERSSPLIPGCIQGKKDSTSNELEKSTLSRILALWTKDQLDMFYIALEKYGKHAIHEISKYIGDKNVIQVGQLISQFQRITGKESEECSSSADEAEEIPASVILQEFALSFSHSHSHSDSSSSSPVPLLSPSSVQSPKYEEDSEKYNIPLITNLLFHINKYHRTVLSIYNMSTSNSDHFNEVVESHKIKSQVKKEYRFRSRYQSDTEDLGIHQNFIESECFTEIQEGLTNYIERIISKAILSSRQHLERDIPDVLYKEDILAAIALLNKEDLHFNPNCINNSSEPLYFLNNSNSCSGKTELIFGDEDVTNLIDLKSSSN